METFDANTIRHSVRGSLKEGLLPWEVEVGKGFLATWHRNETLKHKLDEAGVFCLAFVECRSQEEKRLCEIFQAVPTVDLEVLVPLRPAQRVRSEVGIHSPAPLLLVPIGSGGACL